MNCSIRCITNMCTLHTVSSESSLDWIAKDAKFLLQTTKTLDVQADLNLCSCIKFYENSCLKLFLNGPEAVLKEQNPCSNHEIHVLFEHGF